MNLNELFELQAKLDDRIVKEKGLYGEDLLPKKILALQVELGELANEWRGFKFWSNNREPRLKGYKEIKCKWCNGSGDDGSGVCPDCKCEGYVYKEYNPLLEEYVDCLHFILSIGLELETTNIVIDSDYTGADTTETFIFAFETVIELAHSIRDGNKSYIYQVYEELFNLFVGLGEKYLGFDWNQIEQAYLNKNNINHQRQESGY